jgi:hypothetical protein
MWISASPLQSYSLSILLFMCTVLPGDGVRRRELIHEAVMHDKIFCKLYSNQLKYVLNLRYG